MKQPTADYLQFHHRGTDIGAYLRGGPVWLDFSIQQPDFFREANLSLVPPGNENLPAERRRIYDLKAEVSDMFGSCAQVTYKDGKILDARAHAPSGMMIYPHLGFSFLSDLQQAALHQRALPTPFLEQLERIKETFSLDSLEGFLRTLEQKGTTLDMRFNRAYIENVMGKPHYLPENVRNGESLPLS